MPNENMIYKLRILYEVGIAKWRIDDQNNPDNREWSLQVYDRNKEEWNAVNDCNREGEYVLIKHIQVLEE
jgi:uncharacterized membrane protein